ncbi:MAG: hypothetical protein ACPG7F_14370 [Aggregatilineales bacterium]
MRDIVAVLRRPIVIIPLIILLLIGSITFILAISLITGDGDLVVDDIDLNLIDDIEGTATVSPCTLDLRTTQPLYDEPDTTTRIGELESGIYPVVVLHGNDWLAVDWRGDNPSLSTEELLDWVQPTGGVDVITGDCNDIPLKPVPLATGTATILVGTPSQP